jgi:HK97 family phage portal protein
VHEWTRKDGRRITLQQDQVFHLFGLTLDGFRGVTPLTYARETIGNALAMDRYQGKVLEKGARVSGVLEKKEGGLSDKAYDRLKESVEEFRSGGDREGDFLILEEGLQWKAMSLTMADMQWLESQKLSRSNIMMFYGVLPFMLGDTEKSTSWGTGIEQQKQGYLSFTAEDDLTMWEEGVTADLIAEPDVFARFNRAAFLRGDLKTRYGAYQTRPQWRLAVEERHPRPRGHESDRGRRRLRRAAQFERRCSDNTTDDKVDPALRVNAKARPGALARVRRTGTSAR